MKFVEALPKTQTGKIQRFKLREQAAMSKSTLEFLQPKVWAPPKGYANGIVAEGRQVFIAGQIGWNDAGAVRERRFRRARSSRR